MNTHSIKVSFKCRECQSLAASMELSSLPNQSEQQALLTTTGFIGLVKEVVFGDKLQNIYEIFRAGKPQELFDLESMLIPFYCPICKASYCYKHWNVLEVFDSDFDGWYDCSYGTCPKGHKRLVDD